MARPDQIGTFTPEQARTLWLDYQERKQLQPQLQQNFPRRRPIDEPSPHRVFIKNTEDEVMPAYGCVEVVGTTEIAGRTVIEVKKPESTGGEYLFVSQFAIDPEDSEAGTTGLGWAYRFGIVRMLGDSELTPMQYRPIVGSYDIEPGDGPFVVFGADSVADGVLIGRFAGGAGDPTDPPESNPGVVTVEITGESPCAGETFDDLGYHVFLATITSRPFGSPEEMRRERGGELTIFDPTGCMLDIEYEPEEFIEATAFVSLMYGGEAFDEEYHFKASGSADTDVLPGDDYETFKPSDSCKPFGWIGGSRTGYAASIGPIVPDGATTFQVKLPERGIYEITITYGDATDPTDNLLQLFDGDRLLATLEDASEEGQTFNYGPERFDFKSSNTPLLKIELNNAGDRDSRIVKLEILQIDPPTRWEVINRCCIDADVSE